MKNKTFRIIFDLFLIVIGIVFLIFGIKDAYNFYKEQKVEDSALFNASYRSAPLDNIYRYTNTKKANKLLSSGTGTLLIGKTTDPWMQVLVKPLDEIGKEKTDVIYYLELDEIDSSTKEYKSLEEKLGGISSLKIVIVKEGRILQNLDKKDIIDAEFDGAPAEYFDEQNIKKLKELLSDMN